MAKIPLWKLKREFARFGRKIAYAPVEFFRMLYVRRAYDLSRVWKTRLHIGQQAAAGEIGIYVIFPKDGVLPSHVSALKDMIQAGVAPFVVSNLPLNAEDLERLLPYSWRIMERPNFGYDFGGYRDAVLELAPRLQELNYLWIINDSTWFVPQPRSWFDCARDLGVDCCGATSNFAMPRTDPERFRDISWNFRTDHRNFHYASYALGIGPKILRDSAFLKYWKKLEIRNDKTRTVRRGEIGLTQWVIKRGFSHRATCEVDKLDAELSEMSNDEIDRITRELVLVDDHRLEQVKSDVLASDHTSTKGRVDRIAFILAAVSRRGSGYALAGYTLRCKGFQFLKKSPLWLSEEDACIMLQISERIDGDRGAEIVREARQLITSQDFPTL